VPDKRVHRGPHPDDARLFASDAVPRLRQAAGDLSWLLSRGYASVSALKVVGDRYALDQRQRIAVARCACSDEARDRRIGARAKLSELAGNTLLIDGYNLLTSVEAALAGGVILWARDGCFRDMASVHGSWRKVQETVPAAELIGTFLVEQGASRVVWYFDRPVSNSGRLKTMLRQIAESQGWNWTVELVADPDSILQETEELVATADSGILDACRRWLNLARATIEGKVSAARVLDLSAETIE